MMIPFVYTSYKNSRLATAVSFCGAMFYVFDVYLIVSFIWNLDSIREEISTLELILLLIILAGIGFGLNQWAGHIAKKKAEKTSAESIRTPSTVTSPLVNRQCPRCGTEVEPGDTFCIQCGYKL